MKPTARRTRQPKRRASFPPRTGPELLGFIVSEQKCHAIAVIEELARRFHINVEIHP